MSRKNNNAMNTAVAIVTLLIVVAIIGFVFKFTNGLNEDLKTFYIEHNGKQIVASDSTITFETKSEHRFDCKYISAPEDNSFTVKVVPNITKDKEPDFSYTVDGELFKWSGVENVTSCFNINKQANYFIISFPEDFSIENVLNSYYQDKEVVIVDDIFIYQYYFTLVVSNYNESITFNIHFNVNDYSNYLEIIQDYIDEISLLNTQIKEKDDDILELNKQITSLNNYIDNCIADKEILIAERNDLYIEKINLANEKATLEESLAYYETCLSQFESDDTVIITLEVDGSVYSIFTMAKGSNMFNIVLSDTDNYKFNGWKVNDECVDLNGYIVNESITFVADLTKKITIDFYLGDDYSLDSLYKTVKIWPNEIVSCDAPESDEDFIFDGWVIDGEKINLTTYLFTEDTQVCAKFISYCNIYYYTKNDGPNLGLTLLGQDRVVIGETFTSTVNIPEKDGYEFVGWSTTENGSSIIAIEKLKPRSDMVLYAVYRQITS